MMNEQNDSLQSESTAPANKLAKYRRFCIHPIIDDIFTATNISLLEVKLLNISDKKQIGELLMILPDLPSEYNHLKRIKGSQLLIGITDEDITNIYAKLKDVLQKEPEVILYNVPRDKPRTRAQYEMSKKHWPVSFHPNALLESKLQGKSFTQKEIETISKLFLHLEATNGALFYDPTADIVVCEGAFDSSRPLCHPVMQCIQILSERQLLSDQRNEQYLATGFEAVLAEEPCTMCAMALVHCRVRRVFFGKPNRKTGALLSKWRLQELESLNHHYEVYQIVETTS